MLKQFIPNKICLECDVCCRFGQKNSAYAPKFLPGECRGERPFAPTLIRHGDIFICQYFLPSTNSCNIYAERPLDCQLYPFMVTYDKNYENIILCLDKKCPYVQKMRTIPSFKEIVETPLMASLPHNFVMPYQKDAIQVAVLKNLGGFKALSLEHKNIFDKYLKNGDCPQRGLSPFLPSTRTFTNIYIWSDLFNILWKIIDGNLCIFYEYKNEFNMLLPPIIGRGERPFAPTIQKCIKILKPGGRIENIAAEEIDPLKSCGIKIHKNTDEYIYLAKDIAELKGNKFASHRAAVNHFVKNNKFAYRPFTIDDIDACLNLYTEWAGQRKRKMRKMGTVPEGDCPHFSQDAVYTQLLDESFWAHRRAMLDYEALGLIGRVVEVDKKIKAYTFAFKMNENTYCVIFETADLSTKGLAQFIFKQFAQELRGLGAVYINAMDDSGLENLKRVKMSWRPYKVINNYIGVVS